MAEVLGLPGVLGGAVGEAHVAVARMTGEELCRLRCGRDTTLLSFIASLEDVLGRELEARYMLVHGTDVWGWRGGGEDRQPFLGAKSDELMRLTLVSQLVPQPPAVCKAIAHLKDAHSSGRSRYTALKSLKGSGAIRGDPELVEAVIACLHDPVGMARELALAALREVAEKGDQHVIGAVSACLASESVPVRCDAAVTLGRIAVRGDQRAIEAVTAVLNDPRRFVRHAAQEALKNLQVSSTSR